MVLNSLKFICHGQFQIYYIFDRLTVKSQVCLFRQTVGLKSVDEHGSTKIREKLAGFKTLYYIVSVFKHLATITLIKICLNIYVSVLHINWLVVSVIFVILHPGYSLLWLLLWVPPP